MASRAHAISLALLLCGCAGAPQFPLREPMQRDDDERPFSPAPEEYESAFVWDGANQIVFRPIARFFAVDPGGRATNVNAFDEVPDSSWFQNRIGTGLMTIDDVSQGACEDRTLTPDMPEGSWVIDQGKPNGANPGFRVDVPGLGKFLLKADPDGEPERATGATAVAARLYHAMGYYAPCDSVVYFDPKLLKLEPGLTSTDNSGVTRPFDEAALAKLLSKASRRDGLIRMGTSAWLPGKPLGPYRYEGTRDDDPNDVVPHEDRRELRGGRLLAAWLNHFDTREQNTMDVFVPVRRDDEKSPGFVRHYILDLGDCFGSVWEWEGVTRRLGFAYYFDPSYVAEDFVTLGTVERPWERAKATGGVFNFFSARDFEPELWRGGYPNPAFTRMTEADGAWMTRLIAQLEPAHVRAAIAVGQYDQQSTRYLEQTLLQRRQVILERYLTRLSPLAKLRVEGDQLCGVDLARATGVVPDEGLSYRGRVLRGERSRPLPAFETRLGGQFCVTLPGRPPLAAGRPWTPSYLVAEISNGYAEGLLSAHLYDLGPGHGYRLVGVERN